MSITPVSANADSTYMPLNNNAIRMLEKQKMRLQEQIQQTNESKLDDKTKQERVKQLQEQIQQVDMQIQQLRNEKLNQNKNNNTDQQTASSQSNGTGNGNSSLIGMSDLLEASVTYSKAKIMSSTKNSLNAKGRILKKEIESDESRSLSGSKAVSKRQELQEIESRVQVLDKKVSEANQHVDNQVKEAADKAIKNEKSNNAKDETLADDISDKRSPQQELKGEDKAYQRVDIKV